MRKIIIIIATIALMLFSSCEEKEPIRKGDVLIYSNENPFNPITDTIVILDIKDNYCLYELTYKGKKSTSSDRIKWIEGLYTKIK